MSEIKVNSIKGVGASAAAITVNNTDGTCTANITNNLSNRNKIINGAMAVHQRSSSVTGITSSGYRTADRWGLSVSVGTWTNTISTDTPDGFANSYKIDCTTSGTVATNNLLIFYQVIEGQNLQDFAKGTSSAKQFSVSFNIKTNKTGTYIVELYDADNNRQVSQSYTVSNTNWNRYTITFPADTSGAFDNDNAASLYLQWWLAAGTNFTSGTLNTSWANTVTTNRVSGLNVNLADDTSNEWLITGVQFEVGSVATDFEHRSFAVEKRLCMRYFQKYVNIGASGFVPDNTSKSYAHVFYWPVEFRATPTATATNTGSSNGQYIGDGDNTVNISSLDASSHTTQICEMYFVLTGDLTNFRGAYPSSSDSSTFQTTFSFNAEL